MECLEAQRIVSERLDSEEIEPTVLEEAKAHCRTCTECAAFVRTLATLRMMPLPQPPEDLTERIMEAVAAEKAAADARVTRESAPGEADTGDRLPADMPMGRLAGTLRDRRHRRAAVAWTAAAAVVLVVAGISALAGVRQILRPAPLAKTYEVESAAPGVAEREFEANSNLAQDSAATGGQAAAAAPSYVAVGTSIYVLGGDASTVESAALTAVGTTTSSLGGTQVAQRDVLGAGDPSTVYIVSGNGTLLSFSRVTREFGGRTYALTGGPVMEYGKWPPLPPGFKTPTTADGAPEFVPAGTDSQGIRVYRRRGGSPADGIAVPPATAPSDPAAGNPNWTWWEPFTQ